MTMTITTQTKPMSFILCLCLAVALASASQYSTNETSLDHTTFVFHHCSTQKLDDPNGEYTRARSTLLQRLVFQSSQFKFNRTFVMVRNDHSVASMSGLYQCRGDLDDHKCNECMKAVQNASNGLCGNSMAAKIQLSGCHVQYEADEYENPNRGEGELNHKICGEPLQDATVGSSELEEARSKAFEALEDEVTDDSSVVDHLGFYSIKYEGVHAMAQCGVGIVGCDCAKCVVDAVHVVEEECEASISAQVFMELCYLSFDFNPHPGAIVPPGKKEFGGSGKLVAVAVGGAVAVALALLCCRFYKKKDDDL